MLRNRGGRSGSGGNGGQAGSGCNCTQQRWFVNYCTWALMAQPLNVANASWQEVQRNLFPCSGDAYYDEQHYRPNPLRSDTNYRYGWRYIGLSQQATFICENGNSVKQGSNGAEGQPGTYGQVRLVQGADIPKEQISYGDRISRLAGKPIGLLKNNWVEKTGLRSLLFSGSEVSDTYRLLQTVQGSFKVAWQAAKSPQELNTILSHD